MAASESMVDLALLYCSLCHCCSASARHLSDASRYLSNPPGAPSTYGVEGRALYGVESELKYPGGSRPLTDLASSGRSTKYRNALLHQTNSVFAGSVMPVVMCRAATTIAMPQSQELFCCGINCRSSSGGCVSDRGAGRRIVPLNESKVWLSSLKNLASLVCVIVR